MSVIGKAVDFGAEIFNINKRIKELEEKVARLESNIPKTPSKFSCKSCDKGIYRPTSGQYRIKGVVFGRWKCDNPDCEHPNADITQCKILSET